MHLEPQLLKWLVLPKLQIKSKKLSCNKASPMLKCLIYRYTTKNLRVVLLSQKKKLLSNQYIHIKYFPDHYLEYFY